MPISKWMRCLSSIVNSEDIKMKNKPIHTPEPWYAENKIILGSTPEDGQIGGAHDPEDANRIISCVNSMQGIENPQEFVEAAKELLSLSKLIHKTEMLYEENERHVPWDELNDAICRIEKAFGVK